MISVTRPKEPRSLSTKAKEWTADLLAAIRKEKEDGTRIPPALWRRYNKPDVRKALDEMYGSKCCYCESRVTHVATQNIEHRKPKAKGRFPKYTFDWKNLHLACPACNSKKSDLWDEENPILDAASDAPIEAHLTYTLNEEHLHRSAITARGKTTIEHADLNRTDLADQRTRAVHYVIKTIISIKEKRASGLPLGDEMLQELEKTASRSNYGSMIRWALQKLM